MTKVVYILLFGLTVVGSLVAAPKDLSAEEILRLDAVEIEGKLDSPQAAYILQRSSNLKLGSRLELEDERLTLRIIDSGRDKIFQLGD